ncbi:MAG: glycerol-3-phosphate 1-O-acyltransferase PlsY [Bacteroidales bacterium]|jgi:glycerol-3-phosphate acyltransferase PlsY|nr:glycerol-3-phosphate 1-O-acyltransferase PlsY [Bacteroidales bacterium]MDI9592094.1 glycerol-3-phosphate 1-O-acyltransferase PlsY [Bacteroidota bacterium]NLH33005.1 glycerol-3-phosphate 1-O-acyltransferase PlsY [Lentimicrobium sp.]MCO6467346.1 glycerol-3-phosphate 1-O-acyltransferase PlsY [Bacteroidales bacterium]HNY60177.1 glycerol-3-phosphate 1-O-acyltransferase PlsY [Bacteroidales bacterium]
MNSELLYIIIGIVVAYLIGSIPSAVWIGRMFWGVDVRNEGSGNAGATNTIRVLGIKAGIPVLLFDVFKGWLAVWLFRFLPFEMLTDYQSDLYRILISISAVLGHIFPVYIGFRGGKGIATLLGVGIALYPQAVLVAVAIFIVMLILTGYVSLSSITASVTFPFLVFFFFNNVSFPMLVLSVLVGIFVPITHRNNIRRLLHNEEAKFRIKKNK